jgi:hypothetical protein
MKSKKTQLVLLVSLGFIGGMLSPGGGRPMGSEDHN